MNLYLICVLRTGLVALITMLSACGGAGSELDAPDLTSAGTGASIAPATVSTPLNIAVKPVANSSSPTTAAASGDLSGATSSGAPIGVATVSGK
jgi:hypothetical protein